MSSQMLAAQGGTKADNAGKTCLALRSHSSVLWSCFLWPDVTWHILQCTNSTIFLI